MKTAALVLLLAIGACAEPEPVVAPTPEELREQIHAATGHEPTHCTDMTQGDGVLTLAATGPEPRCLIVAADSVLAVVNQDEVSHTVLVSDPANSVLGRHVRVEASVEAGAEYRLDPVSSLIGVGIYPYWLEGEQELGHAGTIIVRSP
jgi:hypothetical protein